MNSKLPTALIAFGTTASLFVAVAILGTGLNQPTVVTAESPATGAMVEVGRKQFNTYCSSCHGLDARGDGPAAGALSVAPPDLRSIAARRGGKFPVQEISDIIDGRNPLTAHGSREMPIWGRRFSQKLGGGTLGEEAVRGELYVLIEYLQSIQK